MKPSSDAKRCANCLQVHETIPAAPCILVAFADIANDRAEMNPPIGGADLAEIDADAFWEIAGPTISALEEMVQDAREEAGS